jgi:hypothetical protein
MLLAGAAALLLAGLTPYAALRAGLDRLTRDGAMEIFSPALASWFQPLLLAGGALLLAGGLACLARPGWAAAVAGFPRCLARDGRDFARALGAVRISPAEWAGLGLALAAGVWARLVLLRAPMQYDEAYTWVAFASRSFGAVLTDYHLPNNHIFHSLLVRVAGLGLGAEPWALRLPAFLAGVLMIPAAWLAGRALFSRGAGLLAAMLVAVWPYLVEYGANARGYTLLGLFGLLLLALIPALLARRGPFAFFLAALLAALGLFTVPVMLYPLGLFSAALLLALLRGLHRPVWSTPAFLAALAGSGLAAAALTVLLYLPVLVVSGPAALFGNPFVRSFAWGEWVPLLPTWLGGIWDSWISRVPVWLWLPVFAGLLLPARARFSNPLAAGLLFFALILPVQRPELQAKAFFAFFPVVLLRAAAGYAGLPLFFPAGARRWSERGVFTLLLLGLAAWGFAQSRPSLPYLLHGDKGSWQSAAEYAAAQYRPGDAVIAAFPFDPQVWYYGHRSGIPAEAFQGQRFERAWVLASKPLAEMLGERGPDEIPLRPEDCRLEANVMDIPIYLCLPNELAP